MSFDRLTSLGQSALETLVMFIIVNVQLPALTPINKMNDRAGKPHSRLAGHFGF